MIIKEEYTAESEQPMFGVEKGSDEEMLLKKCESADLKLPQDVFVVA